jgi:hypothetical protein
MAQDWFTANAPKTNAKGGDWFVKNAPSAMPDFTANPKGEGLYRMLPASNAGFTRTEDVKMVPFSRVQDAQSAGYHLHPDEASKYEKDFAHQGEGPSWLEKAKARVQQGLQPVPGETIKNMKTPGISNVDRAAGRVLYGTPGYLKDLASTFFKASSSSGNVNDVYNLLDMVDPGNTLVGLRDQFKEDVKTDPRMAVQNAIGTLAGMAIVGAATHGASKRLSSLPNLREAASEKFRRSAQTIAGIGKGAVKEAAKGEIEKAGKARTTALGKAREEAGTSAQERAAIREKNLKVLKEHQDRIRLENDVKKSSQELAKRHEAAQTKAEKENDANWDQVHKALDQEETPVAPLKTIAKSASAYADPVTLPIVRSILHEGGVKFDNVGRPIVNGKARQVIANNKEVPINDRNYSQFYEMQYGELPPVGDNAGNTSFARLQRLRTYTLNRMYSGGRLEAGTYNSLKMILNGIDQSMDAIAVRKKMTKQLTRARASHTQMMEAFHDSPTDPRTVQTQSLRETSPELAKEQGIANRREKLSAYDPEISRLSSELDTKRTALKGMSKEPLREGLQQYPERPTTQPLPLPGGERPVAAAPRPTLDVQAERVKMLESKAKRVGLTGYDYAILGSSLMEAFRPLFHGAGEVAFRTGAWGYVGSKLAFQTLLRNPRFVEWVSRATPEEVAGLRQLPNAERLKIADVTRNVIQASAKEGRPITVSPSVAGFLASGAGQPQSLQQLRKQAQQLQSTPAQAPAQQPAPTEPTKETQPESPDETESEGSEVMP